jgi:hypothetical protein
MTGLPHAVVSRAKTILLPTLRCERGAGLPIGQGGRALRKRHIG